MLSCYICFVQSVETLVAVDLMGVLPKHVLSWPPHAVKTTVSTTAAKPQKAQIRHLRLCQTRLRLSCVDDLAKRKACAPGGRCEEGGQKRGGVEDEREKRSGPGRR